MKCHIDSWTPGMLLAFLPGLSSFFHFSLFLSRCVHVFVSSIIFHFSRSCPSLASASFATLSSPHATLPSLLTDYRDSSLPSFFRSIALLSAALPFFLLKPFSMFSFSIPLSFSTYSLPLSSTYGSVLFVRFSSLLSLNHSPHTVFFSFPVSQFTLSSSRYFSFPHSSFDPVSPTLAYVFSLLIFIPLHSST